MKSHLIMTVILFLLMIFFPLITLTESGKDAEKNTFEQTTEEATSKSKESTATETVSLMTSAIGTVTEMSAEDYVYGAVCAEMPASFHAEALKAQAVASYTYMKWLKENADNIQKKDSHISDNPSVHQAFLSEDELKKRWGSSYSIYSQKVKEAVNEVLYEYLTYEGETAMTVFHGLSPGHTVSSESIWSSPVEYLQAVAAPGDSLSPDAVSTVTLTKDEFVKPFKDAKAEDADNIFKGIKTDENGFISEIKHKNVTLTATDLRSAYELKSPHFKAKMKNDDITLTVYGKGHGVGMSQYSADYMARQGSSYKEILAHFYKGTVLNSQ